MIRVSIDIKGLTRNVVRPFMFDSRFRFNIEKLLY